MKKIFIILFFITTVLNSFAQSDCNIKKAYAFYTVSVPGMQMSDDNGNPIPPQITVNRFIYIEWSGAKDPEIETVLYNNMALSANLTAVEADSVVLGSNFSNNPDFKVVSKKCNSLWKIDLRPLKGDPMPDQNCKNIIIKTKGTGNACSFNLAKEIQLNLLPRY